jgi:rfaE bifunctional protein kinase chain/domain
MLRRMPAPSSLVARFPGVHVAVLGDFVADEYLYGETERVSREAPVLVVRHESTDVKPGGAANAAANVVALGARALPVGVLGKDAAGDALVRWFEDAGADAQGLLQPRDRVTETKTRILAGGRSTTRQQMLRVDRADDRPLAAGVRRRLERALAEACLRAQAVMVSDYGSGLVDDRLVERLQVLGARVPVCVDSRYGLRRFKGAALVKPNEPELEAAFGARLRDESDVERAGRTLLDELGAGALVATRGRHGMWLFVPGKPTYKVPVFGPAEAVDVTGAGDTVLAALACALGAGASHREAVELANVAGGIVVQKPGTATCSASELASALRTGRVAPALRQGARP